MGGPWVRRRCRGEQGDAVQGRRERRRRGYQALYIWERQRTTWYFFLFFFFLFWPFFAATCPKPHSSANLLLMSACSRSTATSSLMRARIAGSPGTGASTAAIVAGGGERLSAPPSAIGTFLPPVASELLPQQCAPTHTTCLLVPGPCYGQREGTTTWTVLGACAQGLRHIRTSARTCACSDPFVHFTP